jgi:DNA-binding CsgD family transcriptional regulator
MVGGGMIQNNEQWLSIVNGFNSAAFGGDWPTALSAFADACGAESGQLIGIGSDTAVPFNWMTRLDPAATEEFVEIEGGNPALNPRVRFGIKAPILQSWHDVECSTQEELRRNFAYADFCRRHDIPHGSQASLLREDGMLIGLAVLRGQERGVPQAQDRLAFETLAPHIRSAVLTQIRLAQDGASVITGALDGLSIAAFICDCRGMVRAMTSAAAEALSSGVLRLKAGRLSAARPDDTRALEEAIALAALGPAPHRRSNSTILVRHGDAPLELDTVDVIALPQRPHGFGFEPRVMVAIPARAGARRDAAEILVNAFSLTPVEADVALRLAEGDSREAIATERQTSVETIRSHIKKIFAKLDVRREAELAARLRHLT